MKRIRDLRVRFWTKNDYWSTFIFIGTSSFPLHVVFGSGLDHCWLLQARIIQKYMFNITVVTKFGWDQFISHG
jgi:hypothetical protein